MTCEKCIHYEICNDYADGNIMELMRQQSCFRYIDASSYKPQWISCAERLPTAEDAFAGGYVIAAMVDGEVGAWTAKLINEFPQHFTCWLKKPEMPEGMK